MPGELPTPAAVAAALALRPFAASTTRRDLSTTTTAFRTAWAALSQAQVLQQTCIRVAEHAAAVLCAVFARLDEVEHAERAKLQGRVVLERSYEFQAAAEGARGGAETVFKVQAAMLDLQAFSTDFLALSTGPSRLDLLVLSLPASQRALTTLSSSLSNLVAHYGVPHPSSRANWAAEIAAAVRDDERALPRLFQRALALRGDAWQRFLAEQQPSSTAAAEAGPGTPSQRRSAFVAWCVERNPLLGASAGERGEEGGCAPRRRRQEASWPPAPPSPTPSTPGERLASGCLASGLGAAPPMRRAVSQPAPSSGPSEAVDPSSPSRATTPPSPIPLPSTAPPSAARLEREAPPPLEQLAPRPPSPLPLPQPPGPAKQASPPASPLVVAADDVLAAPAPFIDEAAPLDGVSATPTPSTSDPVEPVEPAVTERALDALPTASSPIFVDESPSEAVQQPAPHDEPVVDVPAIVLTSDGGEPVELAHEPRLVDDAAGDETAGEDAALVEDVPESSPSSSSEPPVQPSTAAASLRILAVDGGVLLGPIPQLDLLSSLLHPSSTANSSPSRSTAAPSPAQHFALIAGTASSALLAVLLGRLALDLDAAHALYVRIAQRALALDGPAGRAARTVAQAPRRRPSRWSRLFRRSSGPHDSSSTATDERETGADGLAAARGTALATALAELLPGADEPFASSSPRQARTSLLAFRAGPSGRVEPAWLVSDDPSSARGLTVVQAVLGSAAASPLVAFPGWCASPTSLSTPQGALELGLAAAAGRAPVELVSLGTGYASLRLSAASASSSPTRRAAIDATQQAAAANAVAGID
ncbi:hypothetical protein JCM3775_003199 [Rhodotorula graminis]